MLPRCWLCVTIAVSFSREGRKPPNTLSDAAIPVLLLVWPFGPKTHPTLLPQNDVRRTSKKRCDVHSTQSALSGGGPSGQRCRRGRQACETFVFFIFSKIELRQATFGFGHTRQTPPREYIHFNKKNQKSAHIIAAAAVHR